MQQGQATVHKGRITRCAHALLCVILQCFVLIT